MFLDFRTNELYRLGFKKLFLEFLQLLEHNSNRTSLKFFLFSLLPINGTKRVNVYKIGVKVTPSFKLHINKTNTFRLNDSVLHINSTSVWKLNEI